MIKLYYRFFKIQTPNFMINILQFIINKHHNYY
jgi:hypothetical protein